MIINKPSQVSLYELIQLSQSGDRDALLEIINKFKPIIKKIVNKLDYEESETDLVILFIQMIQAMNLNKFTHLSEGALVNYIYKSLKNRSIDLFRKHTLKKVVELELNLDTLKTEVDLDTHIFVKELLDADVLTSHQRLVLSQSYIYEYSDIEIAQILHISRQAVNKTRNRGIEALKTYLDIKDSAKELVLDGK